MTNPIYQLSPTIQTNYEISPAKSFWSLLYPEATINLFPNGSFESNLNPDGSTITSVVVNASMARDSSWQARGLYSWKVTPTSLPASGGFTVNLGTLNARIGLVAGTYYTFSADLYSPGGGTFQIEVPTNVVPTAIPTSNSLVMIGDSARLAVTFYYPNGANGSGNFVIRKTSGAVTPFWTDAWQLEQKGYPTFYCDGDQPGCTWVGTPYLPDSYSSRAAYNPDGYIAPGRQVNFKDLGLRSIGQTSAGLPDPQNLSVARGLLGGAKYQRTTAKSHILTIPCILNADQSMTPLAALAARREILIQYFAPDALSQNAAPIGLRYQLLDEYGVAIGKALDMPCYYLSGLGGNTNNVYSETIPLSFVRFTSPALAEIYDIAKSLTLATTSASYSSSVTTRKEGGTIFTYPDSSGLNLIPPATTFIIQPAPGLKNGSAYLGGSAGAIGVPGLTENGNPSSNLILSIASGNVLAVSRNNTELPYIGGDFVTRTSAVPNFAVGALTGAAASLVGSAAPNGTVRAVLDDSQGNIYIAGDFTTVGGITANRVARYNIASNTWFAVGTGLNASGRALAIDNAGNIWMGGDFTTVNGVTSAGIAKYTPSTGVFTVIAASITGGVYCIAIASDQTVYIGGTFTVIGGLSINRVAAVIGNAIKILGNGLNGQVSSLALDGFNVLYAAGQFTASGTTSLVSKMAKFLGNAWVSIPLLITGAPNLNTIAALPSASKDTSLSVGYAANNNTIVSEGLTSITYSGSAATRPKIIIRGPGVLWQIANLTTGKTLYFNYTLQASEIATLDLSPDNITFTSNFAGNVIGKIIAASDIVNFGLNPGANVLACLMTGTSGASAIEMYWRNSHWSFDASASI